jgi:hypothetical protein
MAVPIVVAVAVIVVVFVSPGRVLVAVDDHGWWSVRVEASGQLQPRRGPPTISWTHVI